MTAVDSLFSEIEQGRLGKSQGFGLGLSKLENLIDGLTKSTYYLVFASSGVGKSSFALYAYVYRPIMEHLNDDKLSITLFALEMKKEFILAKLLSTYIKETYNVELGLKEILSRKRGYKLSDDNMEIIKQCRPWLDQVDKILHIHDGSLTSDKMYAVLMEELEREGTFTGKDHTGYIPNNPDKIHLTIVDHMGLLTTTSGRKKKDEIDRASQMAVSIRNRTGMSFLMIMQSNRSVASIERKKSAFIEPMVEDIKESGCPSEDAEIILAVYSPNKDHLASYKDYDITQMGDYFRSIICLKSRYGESGKLDFCSFDGKTNIWKELPPPSEITDYSEYNPSLRAIHNTVDETNKPNLNFVL